MRLTRKRPRQLVALLDAAVREDDLLDRGRAHAEAAVGDARVRRRHLERGDAVLEAAEGLGRVALERRRDAHHARGLLDLVRADVERELEVDGVVGLQRRAAQRQRAGAHAAVRLDVDVTVDGVVDDRRGLRHVGRRVRVDAHPQRRHQRHHLERGARPAVALRGEVEVGLAVVARGGHREDVAVARVERDDRRRGADAGEMALDRGARLLLLVQVDRRVDLHAARPDRLGAVLLEELVLDVIEEVVLAAAGEVRRRLHAEVARLRLRRAVGRDHPEVGHLAQDLVAARLGGGLRAHGRVDRRRLRQPGQQRRLAQVEVLEVRRSRPSPRRRCRSRTGRRPCRTGSSPGTSRGSTPWSARPRAPRRASPRGSCACTYARGRCRARGRAAS